MEVEGYSAAARWVYGQALDPAEWSNDDLINLNEVRRIHFLATTPVWTVAPHPDAGSAESPGGFREHEIAAFDGGMKPPSWTEVPALLNDWIAEVLATGERHDRHKQRRTAPGAASEAASQLRVPSPGRPTGTTRRHAGVGWHLALVKDDCQRVRRNRTHSASQSHVATNARSRSITVVVNNQLTFTTGDESHAMRTTERRRESS